MLVPFNEDSILEKMRDRVTQQFKDKVVFDKYLQLFAKSSEEVQDMWKDLLQRRSIDESSGEQLDLIGRIVGQPRAITNLVSIPKFAFLGFPDGGSYGSLTDPSVGAEWYSLGDPLTGDTVILNDPTYRLFIKSKILKNNTAATTDDLINFFSFLYGDIGVYITEDTARFTVFFGRELSPIERALLYYVSYESGYPSRFIPKPIGVAIDYVYYDETDFFAFQGVPNARGFGSSEVTGGWGELWGETFGETTTFVGSGLGGKFASYLN